MEVITLGVGLILVVGTCSFISVTPKLSFANARTVREGMGTHVLLVHTFTLMD